MCLVVFFSELPSSSFKASSCKQMFSELNSNKRRKPLKERRKLRTKAVIKEDSVFTYSRDIRESFFKCDYLVSSAERKVNL